MTKIINLIGAPGAGKSIIASMIFILLKKNHKKCEIIQEWFKHELWKGNFDLFKNQEYINQKQYELIESLNNKVDYIILDSSLINGLYYINNNEFKKELLQKINEMNNIYFFVKKNKTFPYEQNGRIQTEYQSEIIEEYLYNLCKKLNIKFNIIDSDININYLKKYIN